MFLEVARLLTPFTCYPYTGELVGCPVCGAPEQITVGTLDRRFKRLHTVACESCGLLYTNPMPTDDELKSYYSKYYRFDYQCATTRPTGKHILKRKRESAFRAAQLAGLLPPRARALDFGCGSGEFVASMLAAGYDAHGFEPGQSYGEFARSQLGERIKTLGWQDVEYQEPFDLVTCFHVLEHLRSPVAAMRRMVDWMKPEGLLYVEVPNMGQKSPNKGIGGFHFAHVLGFNEHNLTLAAHLVGLRAAHVVTPTAVIFQRGTLENSEEIANRGRQLTQAIYGGSQSIRRYLIYQMSKAPCCAHYRDAA